MGEKVPEVFNTIPDALKEKAKELNWGVTDEYYSMPNTFLQDIPIVQTVLAPTDKIYMHPLLFAKILSYTASNQVTDIVKHKGE